MTYIVEYRRKLTSRKWSQWFYIRPEGSPNTWEHAERFETPDLAEARADIVLENCAGNAQFRFGTIG